MSFEWKFATLAAVSTDEQIDRASIPSQLTLARQEGERLGGVFVREFVIDGYSRTSYWDLSKALEDIPPLRECVSAIKSYDVLIVKNFDRLGSLGMPLYYYFSQYRKQLHSVQQPTVIQDPATYNPATDISVPSMINSANQNQIYRIAKINDAFSTGLQDRARKGLYTTKVPYGYIKQDKETVLLVPEIAELLSHFPDWYLSGASFREIARRANATGIPSPGGKTWTDSNVGYILRNEFYAGMVFYFRGYHDQTTGTYIVHDKYEVYEAKHEAIWTWDTHQRIQTEIKRRIDLQHKRSDYNMTGLLTCSECGATLQIRYGRHKSPHRYWRCPNNHVSIRTDKADVIVRDELYRFLSNDRPIMSTDNLPADFTEKKRAALQKQFAREKRVFDAGGYEPEQYADILKTLRKKEAELNDEAQQREEAERALSNLHRRYKQLRDLTQSPHWEDWMSTLPPQEVKHQLSQVIKLTAYPNKTIKATLIELR